MFENIKPSEPIHTVALPGKIARKIHEVYAHGDIGDTDIIIKGNHGGYRCVHEPRIYEMYGPLQKQWYDEFRRRYPDVELPTMLDIEPYNKFDDSVLSSCFETNLSDEDIWKLVDCILIYSETDAQFIYTTAKLKKARIENKRIIQENL